MANTLFDKARQRFLEGQFNWLNDTIKVYLVTSTGYTVDVANHNHISDVAPQSRVAGPVTLTNKSTNNGAADADDCTFTAVSSAYTINAIIIYKEDSTENSSPLICYIDTATGLSNRRACAA